jgi:anti-sigma B factor antagonist
VTKLSPVNQLGGVQTDHDDGSSAWVVRLTGEHDLSTLDTVRGRLAAVPSGEPLVIDLSETSFLDSSVLGAVVEAHARSEQAGGRFGVVVPEGCFAARLVDLSGLNERLPVYRSQQAALTAT